MLLTAHTILLSGRRSAREYNPESYTWQHIDAPSPVAGTVMRSNPKGPPTEQNPGLHMANRENMA
jgi:hypothetical protein